jgi:hypothetical protein
MNREQEVFENFIRHAFEQMSHPNWGFIEEQTLINKKTFQEICEEEYGGDLDETLDKFFRNELDMWFWFSEINEIENMNMDFDYDFDNYLNQLSVDDLKDILGLSDHSLK